MERPERRPASSRLGEQTGVPVVSAVVVNGQIATSIDPNFSRPYTNEYSFGVDRELMANTKFSAVVHLPAGEEPAGVRSTRTTRTPRR